MNWKKILKDLFIPPYYESTNAGIKGCKKNSYVWFHEKQHAIQLKNKYIYYWGALSHIYGYYIFWILTPFLFGSISIAEWLIFLGDCMLPYMLFLLFCELDAYIMGTINYVRFKLCL